MTNKTDDILSNRNFKVKETIKKVLQYGAMSGHPKWLPEKNWDILKDFYKKLNGGKEFKSDGTKLSAFGAKI